MVKHDGEAAAKRNELMRRKPNRLAIVCITCIAAAACISEQAALQATSNGDRPRLTTADGPPPGLAYANENCAACHAVAAGQSRSPNPLAPTFESLANRPDMSRMALSALLRTPHRTMPNFIIEPGRVDDLAAYISMLERETL